MINVFSLQALIEREWLQAGYPFHTRHSHSAYGGGSGKWKNCAPTFILFLDTVYQISEQFPTSTEFNEQFLIALFEHSYSSQFGKG